MEVTTISETNNEQDIQIDPDTLKQLLKMYVCLKISGKMCVYSQEHDNIVTSHNEYATVV